MSNQDEWFPWPDTGIQSPDKDYLKDMAYHFLEGFGMCHELDIEVIKELEALPRVAQNIVKIYIDRLRKGEQHEQQ